MNCLTIATFQAFRRRIEKIINYAFESLTPSSCGHSPYLIYDEQRESVDTLMRFLCCGYLEAVLNLFRDRGSIWPENIPACNDNIISQ